MPYLPALSPLGELVNSKIERQVSREVRRIQASGAVAAAHHNARVDAIAEVTETALLATSHVSAIEALLVAHTPHAEGRLRRNLAEELRSSDADVSPRRDSGRQ